MHAAKLLWGYRVAVVLMSLLIRCAPRSSLLPNLETAVLECETEPLSQRDIFLAILKS